MKDRTNARFATSAMSILAGAMCGLIVTTPCTGATRPTTTAPAAPKGYDSTEEVKEAIQRGKIRLINIFPALPDTMMVTKGIEYGRVAERSLQLDLYQPKGPHAAVPGLILIHGGGWKSGNREVYRFYCIRLAEMGYVAATISYRFAKEAPFPAAVQDAKCAVRWMRSNAAKYGIDPTKIGVLGASAGGHLAMMLGYAKDVPALEGNGGHAGTNSHVQAVINYYGPTDLTVEAARDQDVVVDFMGGKKYEEDKAPYEQASPIRYVKRDAPPTLILHGTIDDTVPISQADALAKKLKALDVPHGYVRVEGWPHTMDLARDVNDYCWWHVERFLEKYLPLPTTRPVAMQPVARLRLGLVGLVHGHVYGFLYSACGRSDVELVGVAEPEQDLLDRYGSRHKLPASVLFRNLDEMLDKARPEAVAVFTNTFDHLRVVEACARRGIHVMMEKPLAVSLQHARAMERAARDGRIHVLVNYETTWYPNTQAAFETVTRQGQIGRIHKIIARDGHRGPKEIGMPREFLSFLTDPVQNGAGALYDFGCYGANLMTWLMGEQRPRSVTAVTQQLKSDLTYERVDDEATIVLAYPDAQGLIEASWNWPYNRKDMEIYGERGFYLTVNADAYRLRAGEAPEVQVQAERLTAPGDDPITYLIAVAGGKTSPSGPSSLKVNVIVSEILDAARRSAETGRTVRLETELSER